MKSAYTSGWMLLLSAGLGCADSPPITEPPPRLVPSQVTPDLVSKLTPDGRFILPTQVVTPLGQLTESQASALATQYVHTFAKVKNATWSANHGATVDGGKLAPCDRAVYAVGPYSDISGSELSEVTLRTFGPHWIVPMCASGQLSVVVSLSSQAVELVAPSGPNALLQWSRADIRAYGVPVGVSAGLYSPEGAALEVFRTTGRRVASVPELIMNPMPSSPVGVRWRVGLETPVNVRGARSGATRSRGRVLVGFGDTFKSSGLLDDDPKGEAPLLNWTDAVTKVPFTVVLSPLASSAVELVTPVQP
jgi:hypothetical protein